MSMWKKIKFAFKYNIEPEFVVVPFGGTGFEAIRFMEYEDAYFYANELAKENPSLGRPQILVVVRSKDK